MLNFFPLFFIADMPISDFRNSFEQEIYDFEVEVENEFKDHFIELSEEEIFHYLNIFKKEVEKAIKLTKNKNFIKKYIKKNINHPYHSVIHKFTSTETMDFLYSYFSSDGSSMDRALENIKMFSGITGWVVPHIFTVIYKAKKKLTDDQLHNVFNTGRTSALEYPEMYKLFDIYKV